MPLDTHMFTAEELLPENLNFPVEYEPTKVDDKKYVINGNTGEYLAVVGNGFTTANHGEFFADVHNAITENLGPEECESMNIRWKSAHNNAWAMMDMSLPEVTARIESDKHRTTIAQRIIALRGVDGTASNQVYFGAIDFFCTNGMITGEYDDIKRRNTSGFNMSSFTSDLKGSTQSFYAQSERLQRFANKTLYVGDVKAMLESLFKSDRTAEKMLTLYNQEAATRGQNAWALYSAFTNYASYADERNGFGLRNTGKDTNAITMFRRENQAAQWVNSTEFKELLAA